MITKTFFIALFGAFLACSDGSFSESAVTEEKTATADFAGGQYENEFVEAKTSQSPKPQDETKIIKTADIEFETRDLEKTYAVVRSATTALNASVQSDNTGKSYDQVYRSLIIRVPSENFEALVDSISRGVNYFDTKRVSQKDVGEEFVDLNARLTAKRKLEERYLQLLAKAKNVEEMLQIERELAKIREEIEARQGRLNYLQNQVSMSTISLRFYVESVEVQAQASFGNKIVNALKGGWNGILNFFIGLLYIWPFLIIAAVIFFLVKRYLKRSRTTTPS